MFMIAIIEDDWPSRSDLAKHYDEIFIILTFIGIEIIGNISSNIYPIDVLVHLQHCFESLVQRIIDPCLCPQVAPVGKDYELDLSINIDQVSFNKVSFERYWSIGS